jgi:hypothetical protein
MKMSLLLLLSARFHLVAYLVGTAFQEIADLVRARLTSTYNEDVREH